MTNKGTDGFERLLDEYRNAALVVRANECGLPCETCDPLRAAELQARQRIADSHEALAKEVERLREEVAELRAVEGLK